MEKVCIVLPAYNEEKAISQLIDDIRHAMSKSNYHYEIIVVDDASSDNTTGVVSSKGVVLVRHLFRRGSGAARKTGIRHASSEVIVMLDSDGTYSPEDIPRILEFIPEYDQVIGARLKEKGTWKILRLPTKWFIRKLAGYLTRTKIPDLNSGLRVFKKSLMQKFMWAIPDGFSCVSSMTLAFICNGYTVKWVPIQYYQRVGKSKFRPINDTFNYIITVTKMITYFNPLRIFLPLSLLFFGLGLIKTTNDIFFKILPNTTYLDSVLLLAGIMIFALGLIADLIVSQKKNV